MGILNNFENYTDKDCNVKGKAGRDGIGFKLTGDGNYDIDGKRLTNIAESVDDNDAVSLKVLKEHTQVSQNNYHLQPSFEIYKEFGDKSQLTVGSPPNTPSNHFFNNHKAHHDPYIVDKEADDTGFSGEAWSSMKLKGNQLESGSYTVIFEIFVIGPNNGFLVDDTIIYHVYGDSHYSITTFNSNKINGQYTRSMIQFTTDGGAGVDDGIKFQIKYFGSQYNNNIKFLFYSRVIKGSQSTSFDHAIFNVSDVQDNHTILYFNNLNLNGNLINGLSDPVDNNDATNKIYVDIKNAQQDIAIADKASKSYVDNQIANVQIDTTPLLPRDGSRSMTGNLNMGLKHILNIENLTDHKVDDGYLDIVKDLKSVVNKEYLNRNFLKIKENYYDLNQNVIKNSAPHDDGSYDNNTLVSKAFVDAEIAKLSNMNFLKLDGSKAMQGNLMMNNYNIKNLKDPVDNQDAGTKKYIDAEIAKIPINTFYKKGENILVSKQKKITFEVDPLNSLPIDTYVMNMNRYGIENCGPIKMDNNGNSNLDMSNSIIKNVGGIEMKNDNDSELDMKNNKIVNAGKLEMVADNDSEINMNDNIIKNVGDPLAAKDASNKRYVDVVGSNYLKKDGTSSMGGNLKMEDHKIINLADPVNIQDAANKKYVDNKIKESEEESIELVQQENVFKKVMDDDEFKEDDSDIHKVGVRNKNFHLVNKKTYEFNIDYDSSLGYYSTRLSIDLIYLPVGSYTMVYEMYIDNGITVDEIDSTSGTLVVGKINSKIDGTKTRSIINFTKYTISPGFDDLDIDIKLKGKTDPQTTINVVVYGVKGQVNNVSVNLWDRFYYYDNTSIKFELPVDMNGNKITGVADGVDDSDVINKAQFDKIQSYYFYTNDLKHNNKKNVNFPNFYKYPFDSNITEIINIKLSGYYHIIYTDYYKGNTSIFRIHRNTTSIYTLTVDAKSDWTQLTINIVHEFESGDYLQFDFNNNKSKLYGVGRSTFYIKYLHP